MSPIDPPISVTFSAWIVPICLWLFRDGCRRMVGFSDGYGQKCTDYRNHRAGRLLPGRTAARQRLRGVRRGPALQHHQLLAHRAPARSHHAPAGGPARSALADPRHRRSAAAGVLQPGGDVVRAGVVGSAAADRGIQRAGRHARARSDSPGRPVDPAVPGVVQRDVREGARGPADRADAVLSAQPVRRVEGVRATTSPSITARATTCSRCRASCSTTNRRAAGSSS